MINSAYLASISCQSLLKKKGGRLLPVCNPKNVKIRIYRNIILPLVFAGVKLVSCVLCCSTISFQMIS